MTEYWWRATSPELVKAEPWLHPDVTAYLETLLEPDFEVLEHGSGGSTLWMAERVKSVTAVEGDWSWSTLGMPDNVKMVYWDREGLPAFKQAFDLLLIDGVPVEDRILYLDAAHELVRPGGYVVLDNANRPEYADARMRIAKRAKLLRSFNRNDPQTSYLVTDFFRLGGEK